MCTAFNFPIYPLKVLANVGNTLLNVFWVAWSINGLIWVLAIYAFHIYEPGVDFLYIAGSFPPHIGNLPVYYLK